MWPWEHAAVAYLFFSVLLRATYRNPPTEASVYILLFSTQIPDLIDKSLSWGFGIFPGGHALGHSIFIAVPVGVIGVFIAWYWHRSACGLALLIGYWSHLVGDVLDPIRNGDGIDIGRVLWPVVEQDPYSEELGIIRGLVYLKEFLGDVARFEISSVGMIFLLLPIVAVLLWIYDGMPGLPGYQPS